MINSFFLPNKVDLDNIIDYKDNVFNYVLFEFVLTIVICLPTLFLMRSKPKQPPSLSQKHLLTKSMIDKKSLKDDLKTLFNNKDYIIFLIASSSMNAYMSTITTVNNEWLSRYNIYNPKPNIIGVVSTMTGIVFVLFLSKHLDKAKTYKTNFMRITVLGIFFGFLLLILPELKVDFIDDNLFYIWMTLSSILCCCAIPFYTIGINYACEITYPVGEVLSSGMIMFIAQLSSILSSVLAEYCLASLNKRYLVNVILISLQIITFISLCFYDEKLLRNNYEKNTETYFNDLGNTKLDVDQVIEN